MTVDTAQEPGAPIPRNEIDPELVNLKSDRPPIRVITAAGVALLCAYLVVRLVPDLVFSRHDARPVPMTIDQLTDNAFVELPVQIERSRAVRLRHAEGAVGLRAAPVAGTTDALWVVMTGDGWAPAVPNAAFAGRVRAVDDVPFGAALRAQVAAKPGPTFATLTAARAAFASGTLAAVSGDQVTVAPGDAVEIDVSILDAAVLVIRFHERLPSPAAWLTALAAAGITPSAPMREITDSRARVDIGGPDAVATTRARLEAAMLFVPEIEQVRKTVTTTWGELAATSGGPIVIAGETIPDDRIDLLRVHVRRTVPADARVVVVGEVPEQYWYVLGLSVALALLGAMAVWALARAIKRDYLRPRMAAAAAAAGPRA